ncbi:MAG: endopeptidase La, partial [Candidatus Cloacimonadota bacterium]|nr:endopeptidase La [Candidatus Cloacimonadota bacterium]
IQILKLEKKIGTEVKHNLDKLQREYYLNEQIKTINKELGKGKKGIDDIQQFEKQMKNTPLNEEAKKKVVEEIKRLGRIAPHSQEYAVVHSYLSWIFDLPWDEPKNAKIDINKSAKILDEDHFGLKKVKERIIEYLAVLQFAGKSKGQILCLIGPPGVGKTSLGKSIARALDRKFVRLSLGGVRDEAEIRGHRRTYVGAMPGVIMKSIKKAGTKNPLIMMDEIDKMSRDFQGDPASALLEVLDSEQNNIFRDHYLDFGYDLSSVMFIMTANTYSTIPRPLLDRMEILDLPGYTENEKESIAKFHLIPRALKKHSVKNQIKIKFNNSGIRSIIQNYTRESGVRSLERNISKVIRKSIKNFIQESKNNKVSLSNKNIKDFLGVAKYQFSEINNEDKVGVVTGLAWTAAGGETLNVEILKLPGTGKLKLTGKLGEVMQESAQAALSYARSKSKKYGIDPDFHKKCDLHLHIPEGAIPKDGPSAGVTIVTAIVSILTGRKVKHKLAMTGEISLVGNVLPIGGLPEKLIAAKRVGIKDIIIPEKNKPHIEEVNKEITEGLNLIFVQKVEDVLNEALL